MRDVQDVRDGLDERDVRDVRVVGGPVPEGVVAEPAVAGRDRP
ncbi:hypothetical protein PYK79_42525 [Streptomyces sp. ID05-04B]|nr:MULTISPECIES: hypothetical protein [unclassified Streptomyces]MDX5568667.1 hypothetical protein [Streptomyces sp. ID05-04B]